MSYFTNIDNALIQYMTWGQTATNILARVSTLQMPSISFHDASTATINAVTPDAMAHLQDENMYLVYIRYLSLDRPDVAIDPAFHQLLKEKPKQYNPDHSLREKLHILKQKLHLALSRNDTELILRTIRRRNQVTSVTGAHPLETREAALLDVLRAADSGNDDTLGNLPPLLLNILESQVDNQMRDRNDPEMCPENIRALDTYVRSANQRMAALVRRFLRQRVSATELMRWDIMIGKLQNHNWSASSSIHTHSQFMRTGLTQIARVFPQQILEGVLLDRDRNRNSNRTRNKKIDCSNDEFRHLLPFHKSPILCKLLTEIQSRLSILISFAQYLPDYDVYQLDNREFVRFLDPDTVCQLLLYTWLSTFYTYVELSTDVSMLRAERVERISKHQQQQQQPQQEYEYDEIAIEIDVTVDTESSLQQQVADLVIAFVDTEDATLQLFGA